MNKSSVTNPAMQGNKFLLVKGSSGLGNRMRAALTGIVYARLTGRRLIIDWSDDVYSVDGYNVFHRFFECSLCSPTDETPVTNSISPPIWRGNLRKSFWDMRESCRNLNNEELFRKFSIDLTELDYQEDVLVMWSTHDRLNSLRSHFKGEFKGLSQMSNMAILKKLLREDLILQSDIGERVNRFKENNFCKKTIGVHVRYTDHRGSLWATLNKLNELLNREPGLQIFLATDNIQVKNMFEEGYSNLISTSHWYPEPGIPLHRNSNCPDVFESGVAALVDLYLLSECDYLITDGSSSFSHIAGLLAKAPETNIFDVKKRGKLSRRLRTLSWWIMLKLGLFSWGLSTLGKFVRLQKFLSDYKRSHQ